MQLTSPITPSSSRFPKIETREQAAKALISVPVAVNLVAQQAAMFKELNELDVSPAELLENLEGRVSPEFASEALSAAIDGVLALAPEFQPREAEMRRSADAVVAAFTAAKADTTVLSPREALGRVSFPLLDAAAPLLEIAKLLDPKVALPRR